MENLKGFLSSKNEFTNKNKLSTVAMFTVISGFSVIFPAYSSNSSSLIDTPPYVFHL